MSRSSNTCDPGGKPLAQARKTDREWPWGEIIMNALTDPFTALIVLLICLVASAVESLQ